MHSISTYYSKLDHFKIGGYGPAVCTVFMIYASISGMLCGQITKVWSIRAVYTLPFATAHLQLLLKFANQLPSNSLMSYNNNAVEELVYNYIILYTNIPHYN